MSDITKRDDFQYAFTTRKLGEEANHECKCIEDLQKDHWGEKRFTTYCYARNEKGEIVSVCECNSVKGRAKDYLQYLKTEITNQNQTK